MTNQQDRINDRHESELVHVPRWLWRGVEYLLIALMVGAVTTFVVVTFWIAALSSSTQDIKTNQEENRKILEKTQKAILNRLPSEPLRDDDNN